MPHCDNCEIEFTGDFCPKCGKDAVQIDSEQFKPTEQLPKQPSEEPPTQSSEQPHKEPPEQPTGQPTIISSEQPAESPQKSPALPSEEPSEIPPEQPPVKPQEEPPEPQPAARTTIPPTQIATQLHAPMPYRQPQPGPAPYRAVGALVLGIIVVIMLFISGATAWFWINQENGSEINTFYTFEEEIFDSDSMEIERDLDDIPNADLDDVAGITSLLLLLGIVMMILVIILVGLMITLFYMRMHRQTKLFGNLALLFTLLALIFVLIAPIYYMTAWTNEMDNYSEGNVDSFIGSETGDNMDTSWGPGIGWILALVCIVMILATLFVVKLGRDEVRRLAPYMPPMIQYIPSPQPLQYAQPQMVPVYASAPQPPHYTTPTYPQTQPSGTMEPSHTSDVQPTPPKEPEKKTMIPPQRRKELSQEEKLELLQDRFLRGEISENIYKEIKERYKKR